MRWNARPISAAVLLTALVVRAGAQPADGLPSGDGTANTANLDLMTGRDCVLTLDSGEVFRGRLLGHGGGTVSLRNQFAGEFEVPVERVRRVEGWAPPPANPVPVVNPLVSSPVETAALQESMPGAPVLPPKEAAVPPAAPAPAAPTPAAPTPASEPPPTFWTKAEYSLEGGLTGSQGDTERSNLRLGFAGRWTRPDDVLTADARYVVSYDRDNKVQDRLDLRGRNDWNSPNSPWVVFAEGSAEFDEFTRYDALVRVGGGLGYRFIRSETTSLLGRLGAGVVKEFGSEDTDPRPEGILGLDFSHKFTPTQSIVSNIELFPSLDDLEQYRTRTRAYYEVRLSDKTNLNLRLGVEHRYDTGFSGSRQDQLDYAATFVIRF